MQPRMIALATALCTVEPAAWATDHGRFQHVFLVGLARMFVKYSKGLCFWAYSFTLVPATTARSSACSTAVRLLFFA
jgi:hypothetical protein